MTTAALIVAAGRGSRASRGDGLPKQYVEIAGVAILTLALGPFFLEADLIQVVIHPDDIDSYEVIHDWHLRTMHPSAFAKLLSPVPGGPTRQASVLAGLEALSPHAPERVLIHDAARPFNDIGIIRRVVAALDHCPGAIAAVPLSDTLKRGDAESLITATIPRDGLWRAQTPQGFRFPEILAAHRRAQAAAITGLTDDAAVAEWAELPVTLVMGSAANVKITTAEDLAMADARLPSHPFAREPRTGTGFDVHRFTEGDHVWLCGVKIPHTHALEGHSDADVALHALTDALLGALGEGDIGQHFPPSDPQWKGAASTLFLDHAARRVEGRGGTITNVDVTILCEAPKIGPYREAMAQAIARTLEVDVSRVGVKATTTEGLGFTGRREGIAAMASATVLLPAS